MRFGSIIQHHTSNVKSQSRYFFFVPPFHPLPSSLSLPLTSLTLPSLISPLPFPHLPPHPPATSQNNTNTATCARRRVLLGFQTTIELTTMCFRLEKIGRFQVLGFGFHTHTNSLVFDCPATPTVTDGEDMFFVVQPAPRALCGPPFEVVSEERLVSRMPYQEWH